MRLTLLNQFYKPDLSPTAQLAASLAEHRAARGDEVTVLTGRGSYATAREAVRDSPRDPANPRVLRLWTPSLGKATVPRRVVDYGIFYAAALLRILALPRQDVVVSLTTPPFIAWAGVLHKWLHRRTRLVLWNMDCYPEIAERSGKIRAGSPLSRLLRAANRALFRRLDHLVCLDAAMEDLLLSGYAPGRSMPRATVIPNWEEAAFFPPDSRPGRWPDADALGLDGRLVVLYLGNAGYGHQFDTVFATAESLLDEPVTFLFVGGGALWRSMEEEKTRRGLDNVVLHDYVGKGQTPGVMAVAHCSLITLREDALGVISPSKLHASLASHLPVAYIGPEGSNVDEAIRRFGCGVSLRPGDAAGLAGFLRSLRADPSRLAGLRARARVAFEEAYCDERTLPQFDRVLDSP